VHHGETTLTGRAQNATRNIDIAAMTNDRAPGAVATIAVLIKAWADEIASMLPEVGGGALTNWTEGSSGGVVIMTGTPYRWSKIPLAQSRTQSRALEEYRRFSELLRVLLREQPTDRLAGFNKDVERVLRLLERQQSPFDNPTAAISNARAALTRHIEQIDHLFSGEEGTMLVPDTNALYWNPAIEQWRLPWQGPFVIVLIPAVLVAIDRHKDDPHNPSRQQKAARIARQITEYRRRGRLVDGVPLVREISRVMAVAVEPRMGESLPWLDPGCPDDRIIATSMELIRQNVRSRVIVVTRDMNLQNKLEVARVPFLPASDVVTACYS
jgi:hypothetical protein